MADPLAIMPDDELAILQYIKSVTAVTALIPAARWTTQTPPKPTYPLGLIQRAGGQPEYGSRAVDEPAIQVDVVGGTKQECKAAMLTVRAAILAIANDVVAEGVLCSAYEEVGPAWLPDTVPVPPLPRYTARFRVLLHK